MRSILCLALLWSAFATHARAQDLDMVGRTGWQQFGRALRLYTERVDNTRAGGSSGFLRLRLWATETPYDHAGNLNGYVLGATGLGPLRAGYSIVHIDHLVPFRPPPAGLYYTTLTLEEETPGGFQIVDFENFADLVNFGGFGYGTAHVASAGDVSFAGEVTWLSGDGRVRLLADSILNERAGGRSGPLRLRLWATSTPWHGETILQGYPLGRARLPRLRAGTAIALDRTTFFYPPPPGEYSVTLTLEEWVRGRWEIRDWITYPDRNLF